MLPSKTIFLKTLDGIKPDVLMADLVKYDQQLQNLTLLNERDKQFDLKRGVRLIGFGKAVLGMADYFINTVPHHILEGVLSVPFGIGQTEEAKAIVERCTKANVQVLEGAKNNLPDSDSFAACQKILDSIQALDEDDFVIVIITGGGSSLLPHPIQGISLAEKIELISDLSKAGADIVEINNVRRQLSLVKGGGLAKFLYPAKVLTLIVSDIIGDPLDLIASGPTVPVLESNASSVLKKYNLEHRIPSSILQTLDECPYSCIYFKNITNHLIANNSLALKKAEYFSLKEGCKCFVVSKEISGEAKDIGRVWSLIARRLIQNVLPSHHDLFSQLSSSFSPDTLFEMQNCYNQGVPVMLVGGGETTVRVHGSGKGGRNQEMVLSFAAQSPDILESSVDVEFLSCGTDGIDGPTDAAGALVSRSTWLKAKSLNLEPSAFLASNDSYNFWRECEGLVVTGHTGTNLMDINILYLRRH